MQVENRESSLLSAIRQLAERIQNLCARVEAIPGKRPEVMAIVIYAVAHLVMAIFHEPWYDEAVAWQIARCASVRDILFEIPHYEGHPPLWHLILLPFAKLGAPYELSLTLVSLIFAGAAVGLIIWKSPFPRIVRLLLPFTYFFFYQYGVISRPYCVMMLAFMLLAMAYPSRNEKPHRYTLSLMLLCLTSAYGIVIAGGLAIVWVWEIWNRQNVVAFVKSFPRDKRIWWLAALLALALLLIAEIMPAEDTFAAKLVTETEDRNNLFVRLVYLLLAGVPDVLLTSVYCDYVLLKDARMSYFSLMFCCYIGVFMLVAITYLGRCKRTVGLFFVPYVLFSAFAALVYMSPHHIGAILLHLVFWAWISLQKNSAHVSINTFLSTNSKIARQFLVLICTASMAVSLLWSASASLWDVWKDYAAGRSVAKFIAENDLDQYNIMGEWSITYDEEDSQAVISINTNVFYNADNISPYFEHNILYNYMDGEDDKNYSSHKVPTEEESLQALAKWKEKGYPDILFMEPKINQIWDYQELSYLDYTMVYCESVNRIWKMTPEIGYVTLFVRNDLLTEVGLVRVEWPTYS